MILTSTYLCSFCKNVDKAQCWPAESKRLCFMCLWVWRLSVTRTLTDLLWTLRTTPTSFATNTSHYQKVFKQCDTESGKKEAVVLLCQCCDIKMWFYNSKYYVVVLWAELPYKVKISSRNCLHQPFINVSFFRRHIK